MFTAHRRSIRLPSRPIAFAAAASVALTLLVAPGAARSTPPPNPTDQQLQSAQAAKDALAGLVGRLSGQIAQMQAQIIRLDSLAELAEQKLALALQQLEQAKAAAVAAKAQVKAAETAVTRAQTSFSDFVRATYMSGPTNGVAGSLLTAPDPSALLQRDDYLRFTASHQLDAIGTLNRATVAKSNADAAARTAVQRQAVATAAADAARKAAQQALQNARDQKVALDQQLAADQVQLDAAKNQLATLNNQRSVYLAWKKEQERIAAEKAAAEARARAAAAAAAAARAQAEAAAAAQGSTFVDNGASVPVAPSAGRWTPAIGQTAVNRAKHYLGMPYSFAAGNAGGPTYGVAVDGDSRNDGSVFGFDCSGLTLYAWAPYLGMAHYAATQYVQVGSFHPSTDQLMPGDLVFWSGDGSIPGIGHVAMYIGGGNVIQAPFSGSFVQVTPLGDVEAGYFGATRPLT